MEFAIVAGALLFLTFTVVQAGLCGYATTLAGAAATQGVTTARAYGGSDEAGRAAAYRFLAGTGAGLANPIVTVRRTGTEITVTVEGTAVSVLPGLSFPVRRSAHGSVERAG